jgi:DNA topoisomerase-1
MGFSVSDFLAPAFAESFMDIKFTAGMESEMLEIAEGKAGFVNVVGKFWGALKANIVKVKGVKTESVKVGVKCSVCEEGEIVEKTGKFGVFYACDRYPNCKTTFKKDGEEFTAIEKNVVGTGKQCTMCGKSMVIRDSAYGKFVACSGFPACKHKEKFVEEIKK